MAIHDHAKRAVKGDAVTNYTNMAGQYYTHPLTIKLKINPAIAPPLPRYRRRTTTGSQPHAEMENYRRLVKLHTLINERRTAVSAQEIKESLACSRATVSRTIRSLRDEFGIPIVHRRDLGGYVLDRESGNASMQFPGLWFNASELLALTATLQLLKDVEPGIFSKQIATLRERIESLLRSQHTDNSELVKRVRIIGTATRPVNMDHYRKVAEALATRKQLQILYHGRARDATTERVISPQRLTHYKSNWFIEAWCHLREDLRKLSLDRLHPIEIRHESAKEIAELALDEYFSSAYGVFAGAASQTARLHFNAHAARWVADEQWHPDQTGETQADGSYILELPFNDHTELAMDILKYGPDVEVLGPEALREYIVERLGAAMGRYR